MVVPLLKVLLNSWMFIMLIILLHRVIITAVDCRKTDLKLVFFNNCFYKDDEKYMDGEILGDI